MARVKALLRRVKPEAVSAVLQVADIELDRETHRVRREGRELKVGPTEFRLLEFFMQAPGRVYSRTQLLDSVWGQDIYVDDRTVDVHIGRLRKAINRGREKGPDPDSARRRILHGAGIEFSEPGDGLKLADRQAWRETGNRAQHRQTHDRKMKILRHGVTQRPFASAFRQFDKFDALGLWRNQCRNKLQHSCRNGMDS